MGMDLSGAGGYFRWTNQGWDWILGLAQEYGWKPSGTGAPPRMRKADWSGAYWSNEGQLLYARDAAAIADALERALASIPKRVTPKKGQIKQRHFVPDEWKSIRQFIKFCRAGSFRIY
jgi:hypothetical protein